MPTLPTYPNLPVLFPDQAYAMNMHGIRQFPPLVASAWIGMPGKADLETVHEERKRQSDQSVLSGLRANMTADQRLRGVLPSTLTYNGRNSRKPMYVSPEYANTGRTVDYESQFMRTREGLAPLYVGGVVTSPEAVRILQERIRERKSQLDTLTSSAWGSPTEQISGVIPRPSETAVSPLMNAMVQLADAVQTGAIDRSLVEATSKANEALIAVGSSLYPDQVADLIRQNDTLQLSIEAIQSTAAPSGLYALKAEQKRILSAVLLALKRQRETLETLNEYIYYSPSEKDMVLGKQRGRLAPKKFAQLVAERPFGVETAAQGPIPEGRAVSERNAVARQYIGKLERL